MQIRTIQTSPVSNSDTPQLRGVDEGVRSALADDSSAGLLTKGEQIVHRLVLFVHLFLDGVLIQHLPGIRIKVHNRHSTYGRVKVKSIQLFLGKYSLLCRLFGKSWQAYYQHRNTLGKQRLTEEMVVQFVKEIRLLDPGIGGEKLHYMYRERFGPDYEYMVGRDKMEAIIARNGLNVRIPRHRPRTTDSRHGLPTYPNLVKDLMPTCKNQLWVTDITYIPLWLPDGGYTFCYLSMITDYYTKEIIAWYVGETMEAWCSVECLMQALETLPADEAVDLIHHSDRGVQYCCNAYTDELKKYGIKTSMTEDYKPTDNAIAERVNGILKTEVIYRERRFKNIDDAHERIASFISFYNDRRPHASIGMKVPSMVHVERGIQQRMW